MAIYVILVLFIIFMYPILKKFTKNYKKWYCILCSIFLIGVMACRDSTMGIDLERLYIPYFNIIKYLSFPNVISFCQQRDIEVAFYLIDKIISLFSHNEQFYIFILSIPYIYFVSRFIYKHSRQPLLSFLIFLALNYYCFGFSALRHTLAAAILVYSFDYIVQKKVIKFIMAVMLATLFHRTAIIFLVAYPISRFKIGLKQIVGTIAALFVTFFLKDYVLKIIGLLFSDGHFAYYTSNTAEISLVFFFINLVIYVFMLYVYGTEKNNEYNKIFLNLQFLTLCFSALTPILAEMIRISMFFGIFAVAGLPNAIETSKINSNKIVYYLIFGLFFIFYFLIFSLSNHNLVPYVSAFN